MKTRDKNQRAIALLSILAGIIYSLSIISSLLNGIQGGKEGLDSYWEKKLFEDKKSTLGESPSYEKISLISNNEYFFSDSVLNIKDNTIIPLNHSKIDVIVMKDETLSVWRALLLPFQLILMLFILFAVFSVPILFYKLIISIYKGSIFTHENVKRINKLGYFSLIAYVSIIVIGYIDYFNYKGMVALENYHVSPPNIRLVFLLLMFPIITLLAGQVMKKALLMKEEQDLTI